MEKDISSDAPTKEGLPKELQRILNTLTEDAQRAAIRKRTDSVSISLDPYQKLVGGLVDKAQPEEIAKYTAFIIESVNRVFTPPTEPAFEGSRSQRNYTERIIKAVGGVVKPLARGIEAMIWTPDHVPNRGFASLDYLRGIVLGTLLNEVNITGFAKMVGRPEWRVQDLFTYGIDRVRPYIRDVAFGSLLHMVQDSFAKGHLERTEPTFEEKCPNKGGGTTFGPWTDTAVPRLSASGSS